MLRLLLTTTLACALLFGCKSREELLQAAEEEGKLLAEKKARLAKGVGEALKGEGAAAAESVSEGTGKVLAGMGRGIEKGLDEIAIEAGADLAEQKIRVERGARHRDGSTPAVKVYFISDAPFKGALQLLAKDSAGREIGRSRLEVSEPQPTGKYLVFEFDKLTDLGQASRYHVATVASAVTPPN